ncbi:hypothetical protein WV31_15975 [Magnetospirillum sp. ME-1]|uniref:PAS domain S-box protein n=1 Tax=Magnetospirillum sp. ME-1 TaxID=1639348 RepID=UPI000A17D6D9|nr:PAS domain S-box protein [Magnetospirillum sp. ME-1]ARJ67059.1 hypothetical protein WV31_15975 [Magnetospirillum sp. ME-1]
MTSEIERAALLLNESRFRLALAGSPIVVFEQDLDLRYTWIFNPKLGYAANEVIGKTDDEIMEAKAASVISNLKRSVIKSGKPLQQEVATSVPNGPTSYYDLNIEPRYDEAGAIVGIICAATDITSRKLHEMSIEASRDQLKAFIQHAPVGIAMLDKDMNYLAVSERWKQDFGEGYANLIGRNHYQVHSDVPIELKVIHLRSLAGASFRNDEVMWGRADGSNRWLRCAVQPWTDLGGAVCGIIIAAEDITEQKKADFERSQANQAKRVFWERLSDLTRREREVLSAALGGMGNKAIAGHLAASIRTVEGHRARIYLKLRIGSVIELVKDAANVDLTLAEVIAHLNA